MPWPLVLVAVLATQQPASGPVIVPLGTAANRMGITTDGRTFGAHDGLDLEGAAYSATLLGSSLMWNGLPFEVGAPDAPDVVANAAVPLPSGQFSTLALLAAAVNGNQPNQKLLVTYTDGSTVSFTQSVSDWYSPQDYPDEKVALQMRYRNHSSGAKDYRRFLLYAYVLPLDATKTVNTFVLPANSMVVLVAATLSPTPPAMLSRLSVPSGFHRGLWRHE